MGIISALVGGIMDATRIAKTNKALNELTYEEVVVQNKYAIKMPSFLSPKSNLNEDASLQYASRILDIAFLVIDEPKSEFIAAIEETKEYIPGLGDSLLDNLAAVTIHNMFDDKDIETGNYRQTTINGLNAITLNVFQERTFFKDALYASFAFIEGKDTVYQIIIMSGGTSIKNFADKLEVTIQSFREL